jgi:hypothetical protein
MLKNSQINMKLCISIIILIISFGSSFAQPIIISGNVIDYKTGYPMQYVNVYFDSSNGTTTDDNGYFRIKLNKRIKEDTLKISFVGCFNLNFSNFPNNTDSIYLDKIPLFDYFTGVDMTDFFCGTFDFRCKRNQKKHFKQDQERIDKYYSERNTEIAKYEYKFNNNKSKIDMTNHCIDLNAKK